MAQKEFQLNTQLLTFHWGMENETWQASIQLNSRTFPIEMALPNALYPEHGVEWEKVEKLLKLIEAKQQMLFEIAYRNLHYFVMESGLYNSYEIAQAERMELEFIELLYPHSPHPAFCMYFLFNTKSGIDTYGQWKVAFLGKHLVGVERLQR